MYFLSGLDSCMFIYAFVMAMLPITSLTLTFVLSHHSSSSGRVSFVTMMQSADLW